MRREKRRERINDSTRAALETTREKEREREREREREMAGVRIMELSGYRQEFSFCIWNHNHSLVDNFFFRFNWLCIATASCAESYVLQQNVLT